MSGQSEETVKLSELLHPSWSQVILLFYFRRSCRKVDFNSQTLMKCACACACVCVCVLEAFQASTLTSFPLKLKQRTKFSLKEKLKSSFWGDSHPVCVFSLKSKL